MRNSIKKKKKNTDSNLTSLQNLLKQTDSRHPDHYLLLVCIQRFRAFIGQYSHLLQHNEGLLTQNRKER